MYVRVPHYVASFWRNREEKKPIDRGGRVDLSGEYVLWQMLLQGITRNPDEVVVKEGCFCERMWRKMLRGQSVVANEKGKFVKVFPKRDASIHLSEGEVSAMCGFRQGVNEEQNEYLCVVLPDKVYVNGMMYNVDGQWQMRGKSLQFFVAELRKSFWHECVEYVDQFIDATPKGVERSTVEGLDRFMLRYDIKVGQGNKERDTLKRNYYRQLRKKKRAKHDFEEFGVV